MRLSLSVVHLSLTLRSYLSFLLTPRVSQQPVSSSNNEAHERENREYQSRLSGISNSFAAFGELIRDMGGRDGPRPVKFPEKFLKTLDQKMQDIAMGKDQVSVNRSLNLVLIPYLLISQLS